mmetsp:Transcript_14157/g.29157  ORF Transcript_14157/g.29157 Transcript_14157/m.29157 type:complete len:208 (-) Transcript_14157:410-1033(-)
MELAGIYCMGLPAVTVLVLVGDGVAAAAADTGVEMVLWLSSKLSCCCCCSPSTASCCSSRCCCCCCCYCCSRHPACQKSFERLPLPVCNGAARHRHPRPGHRPCRTDRFQTTPASRACPEPLLRTTAVRWKTPPAVPDTATEPLRIPSWPIWSPRCSDRRASQTTCRSAGGRPSIGTCAWRRIGERPRGISRPPGPPLMPWRCCDRS